MADLFKTTFKARDSTSTPMEEFTRASGEATKSTASGTTPSTEGSNTRANLSMARGLGKEPWYGKELP